MVLLPKFPNSANRWQCLIFFIIVIMFHVCQQWPCRQKLFFWHTGVVVLLNGYFSKQLEEHWALGLGKKVKLGSTGEWPKVCCLHSETNVYVMITFSYQLNKHSAHHINSEEIYIFIIYVYKYFSNYTSLNFVFLE